MEGLRSPLPRLVWGGGAGDPTALGRGWKNRGGEGGALGRAGTGGARPAPELEAKRGGGCPPPSPRRQTDRPTAWAHDAGGEGGVGRPGQLSNPNLWLKEAPPRPPLIVFAQAGGVGGGGRGISSLRGRRVSLKCLAGPWGRAGGYCTCPAPPPRLGARDGGGGGMQNPRPP